ncbi:hypothetical protein PF010_g17704 [Phytophthora fragariae]|uniref:RxLR effector protein n=1 Tax=Phytophthora fragariae TaxID=53985 RepID=A0A6A3I2W4_9STRA|nr:hypothetical protein PF011_g24230 [Phytophthora fragariae]KAE9092834.1 hypothetical protein PF010_g17704 [Phytophthora fragariae]KAE9320695.1 hypothetical protein PF008_g17976 [Phytophthora fragariae]
MYFASFSCTCLSVSAVFLVPPPPPAPASCHHTHNTHTLGSERSGRSRVEDPSPCGTTPPPW